jgi:hypothetical protein
MIFLNQEVSGQLHIPATLPHGKQPTVSTVQEAGWTPELIWFLWRREKTVVTARFWTDSSVVQHLPTVIPFLTKVYIPDNWPELVIVVINLMLSERKHQDLSVSYKIYFFKKSLSFVINACPGSITLQTALNILIVLFPVTTSENDLHRYNTEI